MDFFEVVRKRHSYRKAFGDRKVPREWLIEIVECGLRAPSGGNAQTSEFIVVDAPEILARIAEMEFESFDQRAVRTAKAIIVCLIRHEEVYPGISFGLEDCCAAAENMLLAVTALGLASVWIDGLFVKNPGNSEYMKTVLGVTGNRSVRIVLPIGFPAEILGPAVKRPFAERAWFNGFGKTGNGQPGIIR